MIALPQRSRQRGVAALFVSVMLCFAMVLAVALAHRNVLVEDQRSANELRAGASFAAAEAGLEWALARINDFTRIGVDCLPSTEAAARSFRQRMVRIDVADGSVTPLRWDDAGTPATLQVACVRDADGWRCSCPASGRPSLPATRAGVIAPAFVVELAPSTRADVVRVIATGCTRAGGGANVCAASADAGHEAASRLEAAWALLPALRALPAAALTVRGDVDVGAAALGVHNVDGAAGALALHAGGRVAAPALRISAPPGASVAASLASGDNALHALAADRFFARYFGMGAAAWAARPGARRVACASDCAAAIRDAIAAGARLLVIDGDATVAGRADFGSADDPVALIAGGSLRLSGEIAVHGVIHAASIEWNDVGAGGALVRGAALVGNDYRGTGAVDFVRDEAVLARLAAASGGFVRVNGSWRDF